jgi:hypothetical protein
MPVTMRGIALGVMAGATALFAAAPADAREGGFDRLRFSRGRDDASYDGAGPLGGTNLLR